MISAPLTSQLIEVANRFGADTEYSRAGGGNASVKVDGVLHIKPSGVPLATLKAEDLVPLSIDVLLKFLNDDEPVDGDPVVAAAKAARVGADDGRRPSVELLFHALIEDALVFHSHPLTANALTCNAQGPELAARVLGDRAIFVPYCDPGVPLARRIATARAAHTARTGQPAPGITLLGNHGIIVSGNTAAEVAARLDELTGLIAAEVAAHSPNAEPSAPSAPGDQAASAPESRSPRAAATPNALANGQIALERTPREVVNTVAPLLRGLLGGAAQLAVVASDTSEFVQTNTLTPAGAALLQGPTIPDQIVYSGSVPVVVPAEAADLAQATIDAVAGFEQRYGRKPVVAVVPGVAVFAAGGSLPSARNALETFTDALRVARDADAIGSFRPLDVRERKFIEEWEAESYRRSIAATKQSGRLEGKVVMVTGAAQGFGLGLAKELIAQGASLVLADLNYDLAETQAAELRQQYGQGRAVAVRVDVSDEQSALDAIAEVVGVFGGVDVFISNAGVLRAGSVFEQRVADFDLVTAVNYRGYFLGVRAVAPVLALQHRVRPEQWFDIIEVNSKSGLEGSKRNFAYAGSKFGGIGLTQSFALELVEDGIKVNAICPGNYLDGPLWTDPERGLFVQYLKAGKVPGATTVAEVRASYESKVPMGRGCLPSDLAKAVCYIVEQQYETGQAVPVTGGQNMLN